MCNLSLHMKMLAIMMRILATLTAVLGLAKGVIVTMPESSVNTTVGMNITLPCTYRTASSPAMIQWSFYNVNQLQSTEIYIWQLGKSYYLGRFKGRIKVANNMGNASLSIFNVRPSDTGIYKCWVFNPNDTTANEGEKSVSVSVLVPPSKPLCSFSSSHHPDIEIGHVVALSCISKTGLPVPVYKWYRLTGDQAKPVTESYDPDAGRLVLGNLTRFEEGYYQCTAANALGNSSCQIDLTTKHSESGIIVGALIASILAAALICVVIWFLISKETKKRQKQQPVSKEMQTLSTKAEYAAVPSQPSIPAAAVPSNDRHETGAYGSPEEVQAAIIPENETQETGRPSVA